MLWVVFPGAVEATEDFAHLALNGHLAHAVESADSHSVPDPEHGCSGVLHLCSCHLSVAGLMAVPAPTSVAPDQRPLYRGTAESSATGHQHSLERPPRA